MSIRGASAFALEVTAQTRRNGLKPRLVPLESLSVRRDRIEGVLESDRLADSGGVALDAAMPLRSFFLWAYSRSQLTAASVNGVAPGTAAWHVLYLY